ncbi:MAG TPA: Ada metal-binding domain-containing protein [Cyclobacteriaceae bacterium]
MIHHSDITTFSLTSRIKNKIIRLAGNKQLKIYGKLNCKSGGRMLIKNRVFFQSENEAWENGFRPCGNCLRTQYLNWKNGSF